MPVRDGVFVKPMPHTKKAQEERQKYAEGLETARKYTPLGVTLGVLGAAGYGLYKTFGGQKKKGSGKMSKKSIGK